MLEFDVLAAGGFHAEDVAVSYAPGARLRLAGQAQSEVEAEWQRQLDAAAAQGTSLFNGRLFRVERFECLGSKLVLELGDTEYWEYVGTRAQAFCASRSRDELANPLAVCAAILSSDDRILVARRMGVDVYAGRYHVVGGFMDPDQDMEPDLGPSPFLAMSREIREETGIRVSEAGLVALGLVYDRRTPHPELCFMAKTEETFASMEQRCCVSRADAEFGRPKAVEAAPDSLARFLELNHGDVSVTGEACLMLYGRTAFGDDWFSRVAGILSRT